MGARSMHGLGVRCTANLEGKESPMEAFQWGRHQFGAGTMQGGGGIFFISFAAGRLAGLCTYTKGWGSIHYTFCWLHSKEPCSFAP